MNRIEKIENSILLVRGQKVMLDKDLAKLYGVSTKRLNEQVRRNLRRFPDDFMFRLTLDEVKVSRSHFATLNIGRGHNIKYFPFVFTEQGVAMLSSVLHSQRAIEVNIEIMRVFVRLRQMIASNAEIARKVEGLERKNDHQFKFVFKAIRKLMMPVNTKRKRIGFTTDRNG